MHILNNPNESLYFKLKKYAATLDIPPKNMEKYPWKNLKAYPVEKCAVLEYAKRVAMFPDVDPKDILTDFRLKLIEEVNKKGTKEGSIYFEAECGLNTMAYQLGIDKEDNLSQFYETGERRTHGWKNRRNTFGRE